MKKWIGIGIVIIIAVLVSAFSLYNQTWEPKKNVEEEAVEIAKLEGDLEAVEEVYTYYGTKEYQVVTGENNKREKVIVWVSENRKDVLVKKQDEGTTKDEALEYLYKEGFEPREIQSVKLGIEENIPIWEIIFLDKDNRLTYYRAYFENAKYWNSIKP